MLRLGAHDIGSVSADDAPSVGTCRQVDLVLDVDRGHLIIFTLKNWIELDVGNAFSENLSFSLLVLVLFLLGSWLRCLITCLITLLLGHFTLDRFNARLVQAHIIDHVLYYAVDVLVSICESDLKRSATAA